MPEGDTVWRAARRLDRALSGKVLTRTDFRVPAFATWDIAGATVEETVSRGKHLLTRVAADERWTVHTHLKMEGEWRIIRPGQRWPRPGHTARVVLETEDTVAVGFQLGIVEVLGRDREPAIVGHLGPDLLGPDWDAARAVRRLQEQPERTVKEALLDHTRLAGTSSRSSTVARPIGEALLDQRCLAGLGTVYMAEVLFLSGVSPMTPVDQVPGLAKVVDLSHRLLTFNAHGRSSVQVTTGNPRRGEEHYVYRRTGQPCRRCGTKILNGMIGPPTQKRRTYWCPSCQPPASGEER